MARIRFVRRAALASLVLVTLFVPSAALAQDPLAGTRPPVSNKQVISANPFLLLAEYVNVEFERKHTETRTFGVSASAFGFDNANYRNLQAFYRYYPQGASLTGFYLGGRGGVHRVSADAGGDEESGNAFGLGVEIGYGWLLGKERNFAISVGAGMTRLFGGDLDGASAVIPTFRLINVGWSF